MKIVLVTNAPEVGGVWTHVLGLHAHLTRRGHRVTVALNPTSAQLIRDADARNVRWRPFSTALDDGADIVHIHLHKTYDYTSLLWQLKWRMRSRVPVLLTEHLPRVPASDSLLPWDPHAAQGRKKPGARHAKTAVKTAQFAMASTVIAVSEHNAEFLRQRYPVRRSKVVPILNGVPLPDEVRPTPDGPVLQVVAIGSLVWRKGFDLLIDALGVAQQPWQLTIYGTGPRLDDLRTQAAEVSDRVTFAGWVPNAASVISNYDVLCIPSRGEAFGYVAAEAMAQGRAVVGAAVDGIPEVVDDGRTGILVPAESPHELARALDRLASDRQLVRRLGLAGRARAEQHFAAGAAERETEQAYLRVCRTGTR